MITLGYSARTACSFPSSRVHMGSKTFGCSNALYPERYWRYLTSFVSHTIIDRFSATGALEGPPTVAANPMFDLLGVRYLVYNSGSIGPPDWAYPQYKLVYDDGQVKIYENRNVRPRAFVVHDRVTVDDEDAAVAALTEGELVQFPGGTVQVNNKDPYLQPVVEVNWEAGARGRGTARAPPTRRKVTTYARVR